LIGPSITPLYPTYHLLFSHGGYGNGDQRSLYEVNCGIRL